MRNIKRYNRLDMVGGDCCNHVFLYYLKIYIPITIKTTPYPYIEGIEDSIDSLFNAESVKDYNAIILEFLDLWRLDRFMEVKTTKSTLFDDFLERSTKYVSKEEFDFLRNMGGI